MNDERSVINKTAAGMMKILSESGAMDMLMTQTKRMMWSVVEYKELQMLYTCAMKEIKTKLVASLLSFQATNHLKKLF